MFLCFILSAQQRNEVTYFYEIKSRINLASVFSKFISPWQEFTTCTLFLCLFLLLGLNLELWPRTIEANYLIKSAFLISFWFSSLSSTLRNHSLLRVPDLCCRRCWRRWRWRGFFRKLRDRRSRAVVSESPGAGAWQPHCSDPGAAGQRCKGQPGRQSCKCRERWGDFLCRNEYQTEHSSDNH